MLKLFRHCVIYVCVFCNFVRPLWPVEYVFITHVLEKIIEQLFNNIKLVVVFKTG